MELATCRELLHCVRECVCPARSVALNKGIASLTVQGLRYPLPLVHATYPNPQALPPRRGLLVANCRRSRFPYRPKWPINLSDAGCRQRAAWGMGHAACGMRQATTKTMQAASCLRSPAWLTHSHLCVCLPMCVCVWQPRIRIVATWWPAGCVALSGAAAELGNLSARSRGAIAVNSIEPQQHDEHIRYGKQSDPQCLQSTSRAACDFNPPESIIIVLFILFFV